MGDGNITWEPENKVKSEMGQCKAEQLAEILENGATPRSSKDQNHSVPLKVSTNLLPLELEELHRNTNNSVNTPELSSASIESPPVCKQETPLSTPRRRNMRVAVAGSAGNEFGLPLGPAAGLGPQETEPADANRGIFSVRGTRSFKINRHRDSVSVFPSGCMGIKDATGGDEGEEPESETETETLPESSPSIAVRRPNSAARNPLTGEGYNTDNDARKQFSIRKPDGNPVLGQGYDDAKSFRGTKVPPGGYSKGLW